MKQSIKAQVRMVGALTPQPKIEDSQLRVAEDARLERDNNPAAAITSFRIHQTLPEPCHAMH